MEAILTGNAGTALLYCTLAGLSTGVGGLLIFWRGARKPAFLYAGLSLAAAVMLYVSFLEFLPEAFAGLRRGDTSALRAAYAVMIAFASGAFAIFLIERFVPEMSAPRRAARSRSAQAAYRIGLLAALSLALHNLPEGFAVFMSNLNESESGPIIALAIALHNIPEGIAVAVPIYHATGSRSRAILLTIASGLTEPLGAFAAYWFLQPWLTHAFTALLYAGVAGIMVYISLRTLLPAALRNARPAHFAVSFGAGLLVMFISLNLGGEVA